MTKNTQYIPSGYKSSPLGIIPEDWEVKRLGEVGSFSKGSGVPKDKIISEGYPCLTYGDLYTKYDFVIKNIKSFIDEETSKESKEISAGDICFAGSGETPEDIGKCAAFLEDCPAYAGGDIVILSPNNNINSLWLSYLLNSDIGGKQRYKFAQGFSIVHIYPDNLKQIQIPVPPLPEQHRIVSVLSFWDTAIEKQTALIEKLTLRKRGLMQQLLTGKKRPKGFSGDWKEVRLGDVFDERNETNCDNLPLLSITGDKGVIYQSESDKRDISNEDKSKYKRICPNDIGYNTMRMWQGRSALSELEGVVSPAYTIVTPKSSIDVRFMAMLIQQPRIVYSFWTHSQGLVSDTLNCKYPDFSQVKVTIPPKDEQTAIAEFFIGLNKEIELANKKLARLQEEKRGLMQLLLTGKKRVKQYDKKEEFQN